MEISAGKWAPRVIAVAVAGYCVWPSVTALVSQPKAKPPEKLPELAAALLAPAAPPAPKRDPFEQGAAELFHRQAAQPFAAAARRPSGADGGPLSGVALEATCIAGDRRLALIDGRLYAPRETLSTSNPSAPPYKIVDVFPYKVLLESEGKTVELKYSDVAVRPASSSRAGAQVQSGGAAKASAAKKPSAASNPSRPGKTGK